MVATVATLAVLTFVLVPGTQNTDSQSAVVNAYSTEAVVLDASPDDQLSNNDVLTTLYETEDNVVK